MSLERIRRNDPRDTSVRIELDEDFSDAEITEALEQNPHIVAISFWVTVALRNWPRFLRHLETRNTLQKVHIWLFRVGVPLENITSLLQAIQRNTNVRAILFRGWYELPVESIVPFLDAAGQIEELGVHCAFENNDPSIDGPALLAVSLQRLTNLRSLTLASNVQSEYLVAIFDNLRLNHSLQSLTVGFARFSDATWAAFKGLMRVTSTIRELVVWDYQEATSSANILKIAKFNFSLREVQLEGGGEVARGFFTEEQQRLLAFYVDRNERMEHWMEYPFSVPENLRPELLHVAAQGNPSVLFQSLLAIRGELGTAKRTRKRKCPAFLKPS